MAGYRRQNGDRKKQKAGGIRLNMRYAYSPAGVGLAVGLAALAFRAALLIRYRFDGLYGQDAYFYLDATRSLVATWTDPTKFWQWLTAAGTPPISVWPLGYHAQMALVSPLTGLNAGSGQLVSLATGTLTPVWTSLLVIEAWRMHERERAESRVPLRVLAGSTLAGLVVAFSTQAVRGSLVVMSDMASAHWATLGALAAVYYARDPESRAKWGWLSGLCLGIASVTRYIYPLFLVPVALFVALAARSPKDSRGGTWMGSARRILPPAIPVLVLVGLQLAHNAIHPTVTLPSPVIANWHPSHAWQSSFDSADGHSAYNLPMAYFYLLRPLVSPDMLGFSFLAFLALGLYDLARRRAIAVTVLLAGWWLLFALFYCGTIYQAHRFVLSYLPPLAVITGLGFESSIDLLHIWLIRQERAISPTHVIRALSVLAVGLAGVGLVFLGVAATDDFRELAKDKQDYLRAARCVEAVSGNSMDKPMYSFQVTFSLKEYTRIAPHELFFETTESVDTLLAQAPPASRVRGYLILPLDKFEEQWGGTTVGETYRHLQTRYNLVRLGCDNTSFNLFEIR